MAKLVLNDIDSLANTASAKQALNENFTAIEAAIENTLSRDGTTPNQMQADIDMNSNDLLNVQRVDAAEFYKNGVPFEQVAAYSNKLYQLLSGTGAQTQFTLLADPGSLGNLYVSVGGSDLKPGIDYNYDGTTITFVVAPAAGSNNIYIRYDVALATEDSALRQDLASSANGKGASLVFPSIDSFPGVDPTGSSLSDSGFAAAAALGKVIKLTAGAIYYLSTRVSGITGTRFVCDGVCTIKLKTGTGGFNSTTLSGGDKDGNAVFFFSSCDDFGVEGVEFTTDGVKEVALYPIRVNGGCSARGCDIERIRFKGLSLTAGGYLSINSVGDGAYRVRDIEARDCGSAQGAAYWTGSPQVTVFEVDNDLIGGVHSQPGYFENIRGYNVLLSGDALTAYGQQTDVVNIAGISNGTDRKGPTGYGVFGDGVGELLDLFCTGAVVKGIRGRNVHGFGVKIIHGASFNEVELDYLDGVELAAVALNGGTATTDTQYNTIRVGTVTGIGQVLGTATESCALLLSEQAGPGRAKNNVVTFDTVVGNGVNMKWVVRDGGADISKNNYCEVKRATGYATAFCSAPPGNVRVKYRDDTRVRLTVGANQLLTSGVAATVQYNTSAADRNAEGNTGTYTIRPKFPGLKYVQGQVRINGVSAGDDVTVRILKNGVAQAQAAREPSSGSLEYTYNVTTYVNIAEDEAGLAASDLSIQVTVTSAGAPTILATANMSFFEVIGLG